MSMWDTIWGFGADILHVIGRLDRMQWMVVFVGVLILGFICMRGFGSRANY
jgi:hypothetical protein